MNSLKCTFKPNISQQSQKLMSPSNLNEKSRLRIYDSSTYGNKPINFNKNILFNQLMTSQISPLKNNQLDSPNQFLEYQGDYDSLGFSNSEIPIQMQIHDYMKHQNN